MNVVEVSRLDACSQIVGLMDHSCGLADLLLLGEELAKHVVQ
jgi:hypothetical protein